MTAHGAGMVGVTGIASVAVMWFFLRKYVPLHLSMFAANYVLFMLGAVAILGVGLRRRLRRRDGRSSIRCRCIR